MKPAPTPLSPASRQAAREAQPKLPSHQVGMSDTHPQHNLWPVDPMENAQYLHIYISTYISRLQLFYISTYPMDTALQLFLHIYISNVCGVLCLAMISIDPMSERVQTIIGNERRRRIRSCQTSRCSVLASTILSPHFPTLLWEPIRRHTRWEQQLQFRHHLTCIIHQDVKRLPRDISRS